MKRIITPLLLTALAILLLIDPWLHHHPPFATPLFGLFLLVSLAGCLLCVGVALLLAPLLSRREDYYE
nr:hypothetical protein [uncultured Desulfuromonas sp.]